MKVSTFIILFFSFCSMSYAQVLSLDMNKCIKMASDSSLQAFVSKNLYMSSYWEYRSYKASMLPTITLNTTPLQYNRNIVKRYDFNENIEVYRAQQSFSSSGGISISQNLNLTGGTFYIESNTNYMKNMGDNNYSQFSSVPIRIGYSQALLGFNKFKWEKKIEPLKYQKAKKKLVYQLEEIAETTVAYYFNLISAQVESQMAAENFLSADTLFTIGKEKDRISAILKTDLLTLEIDYINASNTIKNTEITLKNATDRFASFLNIESQLNISLDVPEPLRYFDISIEDALSYAQNNHPDYMDYKQELMEAEREVDRAKKNSIFDASVSASIGFNQVADNFGGAYRHPLQQDMVSINLSIPLVDWGVRKGKLNMAKNNYNVSSFSVKQKERQIEQDIITAINSFKVIQEQLLDAQRVVKLSEETYVNIKKRYISGVSDINSLTLSLNRYKSAQRNYIDVLKSYWITYYTIRKLTLYDFVNKMELSDLYEKHIESTVYNIQYK